MNKYETLLFFSEYICKGLKHIKVNISKVSKFCLLSAGIMLAVNDYYLYKSHLMMSQNNLLIMTYIQDINSKILTF